jgi:hypothetical protein
LSLRHRASAPQNNSRICTNPFLSYFFAPGVFLPCFHPIALYHKPSY